MHNTKVVLKDGREFCGPIWSFNPELGFLVISGSDSGHAFDNLYFEDIASAITEDGRQGEEMDELKRARQYMKDARKYNWHGPDLPVQEWEKQQIGEQSRSRIPTDVPPRAFFISSYDVCSWSPEPANQPGISTEVHILLNVPAFEFPIVVRLKSKEACDQLIEALNYHRSDVWPTP